LCDCSNRTVH